MSGEAVSPRTAVERLLALRAGELVPSGPTEAVDLVDLSGRVLAEPVTAPRDVPSHDRASMDGFALASADDPPLRVVGEVAPEDEPPALDRGEAVAVATGAPLPERADAVLTRERADLDGDRLPLPAPAPSPGDHVTPAGTTATGGERLLPAGRRLAPRHAALLRDAGVERVTVRRRLDVAVLATGTEIHEGRQPDRDSEALANLVSGWGHEPTIESPVPDDEAAVSAAIESAAADRDLVITTGGTSVGRADYVVDVLAEHDLRFRGVDLRPGRPTTVATVGGTPVCALPGKPIAAHTAATLLLRPLLTGDDARPTVDREIAARVTLPDADLTYAIPVSLAEGRATPVGHAASGLSIYGERFAPGRVAGNTRVALADGLVLTREALDPGETVAVVPYEVLT